VALAENYSKKLRVGSVAINETVHSYSDLPSGGIKNSGYGREGYRDGLLEIAYKKSIIGKNY
jgi:acyl-CoA reductase-like NAD-dependent aldehyde dehydrogenase